MTGRVVNTGAGELEEEPHLMSKTELRIGLLGCGPIAQFAHLPALAKARGVQLTAICEGAEDLLTAVGRRVGNSALFTDYATFLAEADIEAVLIAAADEFHVPLAIQALRAGKHVLVEKPLAGTVAEGKQLLSVLRENGPKLQVGSMKRHDPGIVVAHEFIQERLGRILSVSGWYCDTLFRSALQETVLPPLLASRQSIRPAMDPKADKRHYSLVTHGAHLFDNLRYLAGKIGAVTAKLAERCDQHSWHGLLEFSHGGLGHFELTVKVNADWSEGYRIYGEFGSVEVNTFLPFYYRPSHVRAFDARKQQWQIPLGAHSNPYKNQLEAFARAVRKGHPVNPDVVEGLATLRLLEAVESSVANGNRVEIEPDQDAT